jgi:hypothetical protein
MAFKSKRPGMYCGRRLNCGEPAKVVESFKEPGSLPSRNPFTHNEIALILRVGPKNNEGNPIGGKLRESPILN